MLVRQPLNVQPHRPRIFFVNDIVVWDSSFLDHHVPDVHASLKSIKEIGNFSQQRAQASRVDKLIQLGLTGDVWTCQFFHEVILA